MRSSKKLLAWSLLSLLAVALLAGPCMAQEDDDDAAADVVSESDDEYEDVQTAHLLVYKSRVFTGEDTQQVIVGRNCTIKIEIFNAGSGPARDVQLHDTLPPQCKLVKGSLKANLGTISSDSLLTHSYVIQFTTGGQGLQLPAAQVAYKADDTSVVMGKSSAYVIFVLTAKQQILLWLLLAGKYSTAGLAHKPEHWRNIAIFFGVVLGLFAANESVKAMSSTTKTRKRTNALKELEKDE